MKDTADKLETIKEKLSNNAAEFDGLVSELIAEAEYWKHRCLAMHKATLYPEAAVRAVWEHGAEGGETPFSIGVSADGIWELNKPEVARIFTEALQKGEMK